MNEAIKMQISAFVDGELPQNEAELLLRRMCQDTALRQQTAEYLAMGRIMRGERTVAGMATLRERILAELDDKALAIDTSVATPSSRFVKPLAGAAIAATVALVALLGLQRMNGVPEPQSPPVGNNDVSGVVEANYTVPDVADEQLRDYYLRHNESSSNLGANRINSPIVTLQLADGVVVEHEPVDDAADVEPDDSDAVEADGSETP